MADTPGMKTSSPLRDAPLGQRILPTRPEHRITDYLHHGGRFARPTWRGRQHALALAVLLPGLVWLFVYAASNTSGSHVVAAAVYVAALVAVLAVSSSYHILTGTRRSQLVMQRIDRATIYVLIAGTYTPIVVVLVPSPWAAVMLAGIWAGAAAGIVMRSLGRLPRVSGVLYVALGWVALILAPVIWNRSVPMFVLVTAGGVAFTVGAVLFALKRPRLSRAHFGYHEVFHSFTLAGFGLHFAAVALLFIAIAS